MKQFSEEEQQLVKKAELGLPTFPKERWKTAVWWIIYAVGVACWITYKVS